jgi:hypothetical protein
MKDRTTAVVDGNILMLGTVLGELSQHIGQSQVALPF